MITIDKLTQRTLDSLSQEHQGNVMSSVDRIMKLLTKGSRKHYVESICCGEVELDVIGTKETILVRRIEIKLINH